VPIWSRQITKVSARNSRCGTGCLAPQQQRCTFLFSVSRFLLKECYCASGAQECDTNITNSFFFPVSLYSVFLYLFSLSFINAPSAVSSL
jgi:hypothetical protein